jgi:hypothetical protein
MSSQASAASTETFSQRWCSLGVLWSRGLLAKLASDHPSANRHGWPVLKLVPFWGLKCRRFPESRFKTSGLYACCCSAECCVVSRCITGQRLGTRPCPDATLTSTLAPGARDMRIILFAVVLPLVAAGSSPLMTGTYRSSLSPGSRGARGFPRQHARYGTHLHLAMGLRLRDQAGVSKLSA